MTIRRANGATMHAAKKTAQDRPSQDAQRPAGENRHQLLRRHHFELGIGAVARLLVGAPPAKLRHVPEAGALHVLVGDFDHQLGPQRLPRQVLALAPAALASRHAMPGFTAADPCSAQLFQG